MKQGGKLSDIARAIGRHRSTVQAYRGREWFDRNQLPDGSWDVAAAVKAIKRNVDVGRQFSADQRHHRQEPEQLFPLQIAMPLMHEAVAKVFGAHFDDADQDYTLPELQAHVTEGLELLVGALVQVACGENPVRSAAAAVVLALTACRPAKVGIDVEHFETLVGTLHEVAVDIHNNMEGQNAN